jgi:hypothetical protein
MGQFGWVSVFRKIAFALCSLKAATQCALNHQASCWKPGIFRHPGRAEEYLFHDVPRLPCRQSLAKVGDRPVQVSIENFFKQLLLVAKCGVQTWAIDSHGPGEIGE